MAGRWRRKVEREARGSCFSPQAGNSPRIDIAGSLFARQGYPSPVVLELPGGEDGLLTVLASSRITDDRLPDVWNVDLRLAKTVKIRRTAALVVTADVFNVFNSRVPLNRNRTANSVVFGTLNEVINPRVARFGLRLVF
jgi:hypothetical protein